LQQFITTRFILHGSREIDWDRTACSKHLETNVVSCNNEIKDLAKMLLYNGELSFHMAFEIRDQLLSLVSANQSISKTTRDWFYKCFGDDEGMKVRVWCTL
jgi:hypothetical protein